MILIVHTGSQSRRRHFATARRYCASLGLIQRDPGWEREFVDHVADVDTSDLNACIEAATRLHVREPIEGVIAFVEHSVYTAAVVARELGLPALSPEAATLTRDKYRMRAAMHAAGIPCPRYALVASEEEALEAGAAFGYPVVVKPVIGGGSQYVRRVDSHEQLAEWFPILRQGAWDTYDYDPQCGPIRAEYGSAVLVESYVHGSEVSVESLTVEGTTTVLAVHDKPLPMHGPTFDEIYFATPSRLPQRTVERLHELTVAMHQALGVHVGASHTEFRIQADGDVVALEMAGRIGGIAVYQSVRHSVGVDMMEGIIDLARGRRPVIDPHPPRPTGFCTLFADGEGEITAIRGLDEASADPRVLDVDVYHQVGESVLLPPRASRSHGHVLFAAEQPDLLDRCYDEVRGIVRLQAWERAT